ncbi:hypothetical protein GIB67_008465 [Kingdonia uniflora]|uniref:Polygalacturonase n=1 Tax=Kingdonia uniflora TaxID=39325 RepID=A0A7J7N5C5_9MAGN|nr:hypothetical protein GIB67_008465 [Kingdonia uniflora]
MSVFKACLLFLLFSSVTANAAYNVMSFGARSDGNTDCTEAFLKAWSSACSSVSPSTIYVPKGRWLIKNAAVFRGLCKSKIVIQIDGTLVAPSDYRVLGSSGNWLLFIQVSGLSVFGGTIDGQGSGLWACRNAGKSCPEGARSITFNYANNVVISGLTSINSQSMHIVVNGCNNVVIKGVNIVAPEQSPNTDGIHVQRSTGVTILDTSIKTGDDCVSIGPGARNLWIERVGCGPGHGISIGSLARDLNEDGVQNVTVKDTIFTGTQNGLRIKSWARPSNGFVKGILYQKILMKNVNNPIIIDQKYCPDNNCPHQSSGIKISGVTYQNIHGTSSSEVGVKFDCSPSNPCRGITLNDVMLTFLNKPAQSSCVNAGGTSSGLVLTGGRCL